MIFINGYRLILCFIFFFVLSKGAFARPLVFNEGCDGPCSGFRVGVDAEPKAINNDPIDIVGVYEGRDNRKLFRCEDGGCNKSNCNSGSCAKEVIDNAKEPYEHPDLKKFREDMERRKAAAEKAQKALEEFNQAGLSYLLDEARKQEEFEKRINNILKSNQDKQAKENQISSHIIEQIADIVFDKGINIITPPVVSSLISTYRDMKIMRGAYLEPFDLVTSPEDMKKLRIMLEKDNSKIQMIQKKQQELLKENETKLGLPIEVDDKANINRNPASSDPKEIAVRTTFIELIKNWSEDAGLVIEQLNIRGGLNQSFPLSDKEKLGLQKMLLASFKSNACEVKNYETSCYLNSGKYGNTCFCPMENNGKQVWVKGKSTRKPMAEYCETEEITLRLPVPAPISTTCFNYIADPIIGSLPIFGKVVKSPCIKSSVPLLPGEECEREQ